MFLYFCVFPSNVELAEKSMESCLKPPFDRQDLQFIVLQTAVFCSVDTCYELK